MSDAKISELATAGALATGDLLVVVDVSDTTMAASGTDKKLPVGALWGGPQSINAQIGTTYTVAAGDVGKLVTQSNASPITTTLPADTDASIPVGSWVEVYQLGAGQITVTAGAGATLNASPTGKTRAQYSRLFAQKIAANTWALSGDVAAS